MCMGMQVLSEIFLHSVVEKKHFHVFLNSFGQIFDQRSIYPCFLSRKTEESCVPGDLQV